MTKNQEDLLLQLVAQNSALLKTYLHFELRILAQLESKSINDLAEESGNIYLIQMQQITEKIKKDFDIDLYVDLL
jgi:hypothetical protein